MEEETRQEYVLIWRRVGLFHAGEGCCCW